MVEGGQHDVKEVTTTDTQVKSGKAKIISLIEGQKGDRTWTINDSVGAITTATGTFTLCTVIAGDQVVVNGLTYTGVTGAKSNNTEFSVDVSDCAAATDLALSITCDARIGVTVPSVDQTGASCSAVVTVTAGTSGRIGNDICISSPDSTITASCTTLSGGNGEFLFTVSQAAGAPLIVNGLLKPVKDGIWIDNTVAGTGGSLLVVFD